MWLFLEVAGLGSGLLSIVAWSEAVRNAEANGAALWFRLAAVLPWLVALGALGAGEHLSRRRPELVVPVSDWIRRGSPLVALWVAPLLLGRDTFGDQPVFLMLLTGAAALALEASLRRALAREQWRAPPVASLRARALPRALAALAIVSAATFFYVCSVRVHDKFLSSNYDLGLFENLFWNTLHGRHGVALEHRYFSQHAELLVYALLPAYAAWPHTETLLALQALLMLGAAVPLFLLAERWLGSAWAGLVLVLAYLAHPAIHGPALYDFHFLPLSAFFLLWAAYFHACRPASFSFWVALVLALCAREDVAIGVSAVGAGLAWNTRRAASTSHYGKVRRVGLRMAALGAAWFLLVKFAWMRQFGHGSFSNYYSELIPPGSKGFGAVLLTLVSNPIYSLRHLLTEEKCLLSLQLLVPLGLLPVRYSKAWFLLIPGLIVVGLANSSSVIPTIHLHYATHFLPYLFIAAIGALAVRSRHWRASALAGISFASLVSTLHFGAFFRSTFKTSFHDVALEWSPGDAELGRAFERLAAKIPADASVSAGEYEGPHLARRATLLSLKYGCQGADYVIYSSRSLHWGGQEDVAATLRTGGYGLLALAGDLVLLERDYDPSRNSEALQLLNAL